MAVGQDPLSDALEVLLRLGLDETICRQAIAMVRRRWGGEQCYIRAIDRTARDTTIRNALADGLPTSEVAERAAVSVATVRRRRSDWF